MARRDPIRLSNAAGHLTFAVVGAENLSRACRMAAQEVGGALLPDDCAAIKRIAQQLLTIKRTLDGIRRRVSFEAIAGPAGDQRTAISQRTLR